MANQKRKILERTVSWSTGLLRLFGRLFISFECPWTIGLPGCRIGKRNLGRYYPGAVRCQSALATRAGSGRPYLDAGAKVGSAHALRSARETALRERLPSDEYRAVPSPHPSCSKRKAPRAMALLLGTVLFKAANDRQEPVWMRPMIGHGPFHTV